METLSRSEDLSKIVEAYSRPTRIVRGKDINDNVEVHFHSENCSKLIRCSPCFMNLLLD